MRRLRLGVKYPGLKDSRRRLDTIKTLSVEEGYWDSYMRDSEHESKTRLYIERNPTKAKLVTTLNEWPWSSARFRDVYERLCLPAQ